MKYAILFFLVMACCLSPGALSLEWKESGGETEVKIHECGNKVELALSDSRPSLSLFSFSREGKEGTLSFGPAEDGLSMWTIEGEKLRLRFSSPFFSPGAPLSLSLFRKGERWSGGGFLWYGNGAESPLIARRHSSLSREGWGVIFRASTSFSSLSVDVRKGSTSALETTLSCSLLFGPLRFLLEWGDALWPLRARLFFSAQGRRGAMKGSCVWASGPSPLFGGEYRRKMCEWTISESLSFASWSLLLLSTVKGAVAPSGMWKRSLSCSIDVSFHNVALRASVTHALEEGKTTGKVSLRLGSCSVGYGSRGWSFSAQTRVRRERGLLTFRVEGREGKRISLSLTFETPRGT